jgi:hypothetical protein
MNSFILSLFVSTISFFVAAWYLNRYFDQQEISKGRSRGILVFMLASLFSWGTGEIVDWSQVKINGPQAAAQTPEDLAQLMKAIGQIQH